MAYTTINKSTDYFNTKLYTGTGSSLALTGVGFQPDMVWQKVRSTTSSHRITDAVRGVGQVIYPNDTAQQSAESAVTAFGTDGFTVGTSGGTNTNGATYVGWSWKAGGGAGSSNTDGSINTTYTSVNTTAGFSISQYTGTGSNATVGHGLGVAPNLIITKSLAATQEWCVGMDALGWDKYLFLNETSGSQSGSTYWQSTAPTSTVFSVGTAGPTNSSSAMIAYCFAEKTGFSKFGSYSGNGNGNGAFVYTGFKPKFLIIKNYSGNGDNWIMLTNELSTSGSNVINNYLKADTSSSESTASSNFPVDFFSTGFKLRGTDSGYNNGSSTYVYMAWADAPLVGSNNIPCTAR
tara:strand:- start:485 stop:1531 length:1047 start_codon:yes stop_codon:yes gene_type:complete